MYRGQRSVRGGVEDFLCPFTEMYITQGSNGKYSHMGIMANDVRGSIVGERCFIFAPCDIKCIKIYPDSGQAMFQSKNKVRFANGRVDYATFMVAHDNTMDCYVGQEFNQGDPFFQMGDKGNATGVHTHIQISQSNDESWFKNEYGIYKFNNEYDLDECYFVDNTNILNGMGGNWKVTSDIPVSTVEYINIPEWIRLRNVYSVTGLLIGALNPFKFGGLTYKILGYEEFNGKKYARISTRDYGECYVIVTNNTPITDAPMYEYGNY